MVNRNRVENEFNLKGTLISRCGNGEAKPTVKLKEAEKHGEYVRLRTATVILSQ